MKDGLLIINKPSGMTSHDVVAITRKSLKTKSVGHTGTLDPLATGVLVLCIGAATKLVQYLTCEDKEYDVEMQLGIKTDTGDITGKIIEEKTVPIDVTNINNVFKDFVGKQKQTPPMYSAIKKDGVKLYELARKGIEVERDARDIEIFNISAIECDESKLKFRVHCSKGTYIRVLCEDIAQKLGTCGTMTMLTRIKTGNFKIENTCNLEELNEEKIIPLEHILNRKITIHDEYFKLINGIAIYKDLDDGLYNLYFDEKYIGIGELKNKQLKRKIIIAKNI